MRLLAKLRCSEDSAYETQYHYHLQSFIYNLLRDSKYHYIHNKEGYKFFCFSNVFPSYDLKKGERRSMIISSPNREFIEYLDQVLRVLKTEIKIGSMRFMLDSCHKIDIRLPEDAPYTLIAGTPIVIRIPREKYTAYGIQPHKDYEYLYWRAQHPIELFITQIENNLFKKYNEFYGYNIDEVNTKLSESLRNSCSIIQKLRFKKQISTKILMKNTEQIVIGTLWEFMFSGLEDKKLIEFALDVGIGERNSMGFGLMNLQDSK